MSKRSITKPKLARLRLMLGLAPVVGAAACVNDAESAAGPGTTGAAWDGNVRPSKFGDFDVFNLEIGGERTGYVGGSFREVAGAAASCTTKTAGPCASVACGSSNSQTGIVFGGHLTVTGTTSPTALELSPGDAASYDWTVSNGFAYDSGATLTFRGAGSDAVPAFTISTVGPDHATLMAPSLAAGVHINRAENLTVTWTSDGSGGELIFQIAAIAASASTRVVCEFPIGEGSGTVPSTLLATLPAGTAQVSALDYGPARAMVEDWTITLFASRHASLEGADGIANADVTLE